MTSPDPIVDGRRRRRPRIFDTDFLVLRGLARAVTQAIATVTRPGQKVLDFGCGAMPFRADLTALGCAYVGADFDGVADLPISPEGRLPADLPVFDGVVSFQVLEHVRDLDLYFAEASRALVPGGWMILSTHGTWLYHPHPGDYRRWTRDGLIDDIERRGFAVSDVTPVLGPLAWTTVLRLTSFAWVLRKAPVVGAPLAAALAAVMNLRATVEDAVTPVGIRETNACIYVVVCRKIQ